MSLAKKCDRCGKLYECYPKGMKTRFNAVRRVQVKSNGIMEVHDNTIDLCETCMSEFDKFMINGGKFDD